MYVALPVYPLPAAAEAFLRASNISSATYAPGAVRGSYIPFVVRDPLPDPVVPPPASGATVPRGADILVKTGDTTWVAYNKYGCVRRAFRCCARVDTHPVRPYV